MYTGSELPNYLNHVPGMFQPIKEFGIIQCKYPSKWLHESVVYIQQHRIHAKI